MLMAQKKSNTRHSKKANNLQLKKEAGRLGQTSKARGLFCCKSEGFLHRALFTQGKLRVNRSSREAYGV